MAFLYIWLFLVFYRGTAQRKLELLIVNILFIRPYKLWVGHLQERSFVWIDIVHISLLNQFCVPLNNFAFCLSLSRSQCQTCSVGWVYFCILWVLNFILIMRFIMIYVLKQSFNLYFAYLVICTYIWGQNYE